MKQAKHVIMTISLPAVSCLTPPDPSLPDCLPALGAYTCGVQVLIRMSQLKPGRVRGTGSVPRRMPHKLFICNEHEI